MSDIVSDETVLRFRHFIAGAPDHISIVGRDYRYLVVNDAYLTAHGRGRAEIVGGTVADLLGEETFARLKPSLDRAFNGETVNFFDWIDFSAIGRRYMNVVYYPLTGEGGEVSNIVVNSRDLTELKEAQERLKESEEKYRHLFEHLNDAAFLADTATGVILDTNKKGEELLGRTRDEIIGMHQSRIHPAGREDEYRSMFASHSGKGKLADDEGEVERKDGTVVPVHISAEALVVGEKRLILGIFRDLTETRRLEAEMIKAQKLESVGLLAGGIAHEFNNILTGIYGNISLAKMLLSPTGKPYEAVSRAEAASLRAGYLTKQLLTFSKGGAPVKRAVSIKGFIPEWCSLATIGSEAMCAYDIREDLRDAAIDEGQIGQALRNIFVNAIESMDGSGVVRVAAWNEDGESHGLPARKGGYVAISIGDEGRGIKEEDLQRIFDPFYTTKEKGSGLGLSAAYSIVKRHEGHLTVKSVPGKGSVFHMCLPAALKAGDEENVCAVPGLSGKRVLVMDDEEMIRDLVKEMLPMLGYAVEVSRDGDEAVLLYSKAKETGRPFDLVILDLTVPGGTGGREALKRLQEIDPGIRAIVSSGYSNDPIMADYGRYGLKGVIAKPFSMASLRDAVKGALSADK
ncbi:MAG: PAS domain S-box protein [Deltaproteobacteria bacterium]|nr:PAS domain S-box protein [Deltaproteobacteria bacterium]